MMKKIALITLSCILFIGCSQKKDWEFQKEIQLNNVLPIGITIFKNQIWLADGKNNRLVSIDSNGISQDSISDFERPMHINANSDQLLVPEYGRDSIAILNKHLSKSYLKTPPLDAPASVFQFKNELAIADFYNHKIWYKPNQEWLSIGKKGSNPGEFNYPTDIEITSNKLYVADAYNHRVQVFLKDGTYLKTIGQDFKMNASTGIYISNNELFITDFENNRVLITTLDGELVQEINTSIEKPTDILVYNHKLWVLNFKKGSISIYSR